MLSRFQQLLLDFHFISLEFRDGSGPGQESFVEESEPEPEREPEPEPELEPEPEPEPDLEPELEPESEPRPEPDFQLLLFHVFPVPPEYPVLEEDD